MLAPIEIKTPASPDPELIESFKKTLDALSALIGEGNAIIYCHEKRGEDVDADEITKLAEKIARVATDGPPDPAEELVRVFGQITDALGELNLEAMAIMEHVEKEGLDEGTVRDMECVAGRLAGLVTAEFDGDEEGLIGDFTDALITYETGEPAEDDEIFEGIKRIIAGEPNAHLGLIEYRLN